MYAAYLFSVVLGGGLLLFTLLGDVFGGGDLELEAELDVGGDIDSGVDSEGAASKILSLRTLIYVLFGFGGVGWLLSQAGMAPAAPATIGYAAAGGLLSGTIVHTAFAYLRGSESGQLAGDDSFVGLIGRVTLPIDADSAGQISVERGDRAHPLRALPHPGSLGTPVVPSAWQTVVVVEMKDGIALVAPAGDDLKLLT